MEKVSYHGKTLTRWQVGNSTFLALPEHGARLMNWHLSLGDSSVRDILYWPEDANFNDFPKVRGGNPILFPNLPLLDEDGAPNDSLVSESMS